jgi:localization factor PodJL
MSSGAPWSVKGIDPKTREVAKDLARRNGMTLGEWLNTVITNGDEDAPARPDPRPEPEAERAEVRRSIAPTGGGELSRVTSALERLTSRIEAAEHRSSLAISGVDQSVQGVLSRLSSAEQTQAAVVERLEGVERDQTAVAARLDAALMAMRDDHEAQSERLNKLEEEGAGPRSAEALKSLETALGKIAGQLYEGENKTRAMLGEIGREFDHMSTRLDTLDMRPDAEAMAADLLFQISERLERAEAKTAGAIEALQSSFAGLDQRLGQVEARPADDSAERFERLATELSAKFDAARAELAEKLDSASDARPDQMDQVVRELSEHVEAAERRSHQAVEKMGQEVLRIAEVINKRMQQVEHHTAEAVEHVGGEVARVAETMEARLIQSEETQAQALVKLGDEIGRISERLADRIAAAERRSAEAIDDVGEQVSRATDKMNARYDRAANDLADRIKQSEERTARFLEEAREKLDLRLTETQKHIADQVTPVHQSFADVQSRLEQVEATASYMPPFGKSAAALADVTDIFADQGPTRAPMRPTARAAAPAAAPFPSADRVDNIFAEKPAAPPVYASSLADDPFEALDAFDAEPPSGEQDMELIADEFGADAMFEPEAPAAEPIAPSGPLSTRDVLERARAAARASAAPQPAAGAKPGPSAKPGLLGGFKLPLGKSKARKGSTLRTALVASATAAALGATTAGWVILAQEGPKTQTAQADDPTGDASYGDNALRAQAKPEGPATAQAASLLVEPRDAAVVAPSATADQGAAVYGRAKGALEEGRRAAGLTALREAAELGHAPAQLHLANLYDTGEQGVARNPAESRKWTERAAQNGDRRAMHNLGLLYFEGQGGRKNVTLAAQWFRRAADLGLMDSQYNLGLVYEKGYGVTQNPAEAYKWYIIAARNGDTEARSAAERLERTLSDQARATAERSALAFRAAGAATLAANGASGPVSADVAAAQRALSKLGYYQGPTDGRTSPALQAAVSAWRQANGQAPSGAIDTALITDLARAG